MKRMTIRLKEYDWVIRMYWESESEDAEEIVSEMLRLGCPPEWADKAWENIASGRLNQGVTFSSYARRKSVMVVGRGESARQEFNSLLHEMRHVNAHIGEADGLPPDGEAVCYLQGKLAEGVWWMVKGLVMRGGGA